MQVVVDIRVELDLARNMEERGFSEIWQGDNRMARDCIVLMSAFLTHTRRMRVASGVLPIWTRNPAVIAASFNTLWELGGKVDGRGRVMLGLGAWWEPIASRVGVKMRKPLQAMRENIEAVRRLLIMETVTYQGEFVNQENVSLDKERVLTTLDEAEIKARAREIVPAFWDRYQQLVPMYPVLG